VLSRVAGRAWIWFVLPAVVLYFGFLVLPTVGTYWLAFFQWSGAGPLGSYVGIDNFRRLYHDSAFRDAALHNVWLFLALFVTTNTVCLGLAMLLDQRYFLRNVYRAIIFLPFVMSPVAIGFIWQMLLSPNIGLVNPLLSRLGLGVLERQWLADPRTALWVLVAAFAWQWNALATVTFLAGLQNVPRELREAAAIDGARGWQIGRDVIIPSLAPAFTVVNVLLVIVTFRAFDIAYVLTGATGSPGGATSLMGTQIYANAFGYGSSFSTSSSMSYAVAQSMVLFAFLAIFSFLMLYVMRRRERLAR
jgi:raffinose/stachyose/melibiose transport system permease protein